MYKLPTGHLYTQLFPLLQNYICIPFSFTQLFEYFVDLSFISSLIICWNFCLYACKYTLNFCLIKLHVFLTLFTQMYFWLLFHWLLRLCVFLIIFSYYFAFAQLFFRLVRYFFKALFFFWLHFPHMFICLALIEFNFIVCQSRSCAVFLEAKLYMLFQIYVHISCKFIFY